VVVVAQVIFTKIKNKIVLGSQKIFLSIIKQQVKPFTNRAQKPERARLPQGKKQTNPHDSFLSFNQLKTNRLPKVASR